MNRSEKQHARAQHAPLHGGSLLFLAGLAGLTAWILFRDQPVRELLPAVRQANPLYLTAGLLMMFLFVAAEAFNKFLTLRALGRKVPFRRCLDYAFVGFYVSSITPSTSGGQPAQMYYMKKDRIELSHATLTMLVVTIVYQAVMLLYGLVMFLSQRSFVQQSIGGIRMLLIFGVAVNLALIALFLAVIFCPGLVRRGVDAAAGLLGRWGILRSPQRIRESVRRQMEEYGRGARYICRHPLLVMQVTAVTFAQVTALYLVPFFVYRSFGLDDFTVLQVLAVQSLLTIAVSSLPLPGAVGVSENGFLLLFRIFFSGSLLMPAMLLTRGISFYAFLIISGVVTCLVHLRTSRAERPAKLPRRIGTPMRPDL